MTCRTFALTLFALGIAVPCVLAAERTRPEQLRLLGVDRWHEQDVRGQRISVAILDCGFRDYRKHLGKELPSEVKTKSFRRDGELEAKESIHGLLCAETIHAVAPAATLIFANWEPDDPASFIAAVRWCREQGAHVISCSTVMPGWSDGHGGGTAHRELADSLEGCLFFASAGNLAERHWSGAFCDNGHGEHVWRSGCTVNRLHPWSRQPISVEVSSSAAMNFTLSVTDASGHQAAKDQPLSAGGVCGRSVRFMPQEGQYYKIRLKRMGGTDGTLRLIVLGADLEMSTPDDCLVFPGDGPGIIAVGAGDRLLSRSIKPEILAPIPFPSQIRSGPFTGTSAAAPQAAGMAALIWSREPRASSDEIRERLRNWTGR